MKNNESTAIVPGSLSAVALKDSVSIAEAFIGVDCVVLIDVSGSMEMRDSRDGLSRYEVALSELASLQKALPGKIGVIAFSNSPVFCPSGQPPLLADNTDVAKALSFAKVSDIPGVQFILISDGEPCSESRDAEGDALRVAQTYQNKIDTIYCGPEGGRGQEFLRRLAAASGGTFARDFQAQKLAGTVLLLLEHNR